jgi:hypothetical protein
MNTRQNMKPDTQTAMRDMIQQVRSVFPFDAPESQVCSGVCKGCSLKLLEFIDTELVDWERRLEDGDSPNLGELDRLGKMCKKIYDVLKRNDLIDE